MVRPWPGTHRNPGRRPPGLQQEGAAAAAAEEEAAAEAAPMPQQASSAEASGLEDGSAASEDGSSGAEVNAGPAAALPLPHVPPNHHTRGKRPSGLILPRDVHHSIDGTPLPAPTGEAAGATVGEAGESAAADAAAPGGLRLAAGRLPPGDISFHTVCAFATSVAKCKGAGCMERKRRRVVKFMEEVVARESGNAWAIWRLLLPHVHALPPAAVLPCMLRLLDNHRGPYNLKEKALGNVLIHVCGLGDDTVEANKIRHWIKPGKKGAGDFARVLLENVFRVYCLSDASREKELKVREVNAELDALAAAALLRGGEATERRCQILRRLLTRCTPDMAFYLAQIILRELKINLSQEYVFRWWHADAQQLFNCTTSAAAVFNTLTDPGKRISPTLAPGRPAAPQLSMPLHSTEAVVDMMRKQGEEAGGELSFLIEPKLDGERQQVHILGPDRPCQYWSRSGIDHGQLRNASTPGPPGGFCLFDTVLRQQVVPQQCILDGELLVWNKKRQNFEVFGSLRSTILAGHANEDPHFRVDCEDFDGNINTADPEWEAPCLGDLEVVYLPWDVPYLDGRCVCHLPLLERRELLRRAVRDAPPEGYPLSANGVLRGRVVPMLPGQPLLGHVAAPCLCSTSEDVMEAVRGAIRRHEEGIVVKSLPSQWLAGDRNGQWVKIKPDYLSRVEIDALIIGCFWGEDRRAGLFSEFLMGIAAEPPAGKTTPERWISFCKVGSGFTDVDRERLHNALKDNVCEHPPPCYEITGSGKETPHFWVKDPLQSVVLEVQADLRLIKSRIYAAEYSLRFPRMERIREPWDKDALGTTTERELRDFVAERKGHLARDDAKQLRSPGKAGPRKARQAAKRRSKGHKLPKAIAGADVGQVVAESSVLDGCCVCVLNYEGFDAQQCKELLLKMGGRPWETYSPSCDRITHVLAGEPGKGSGWRAAARAGCDIISLAWLQRCAKEGQRVEPRSSDYLQLSASTLQSRPDWDCWGDSLFDEATAEDVAALLRRLPDAASLAPLVEQQEAARERQRRQGQHLWQRRRQGQRRERECGLEQLPPEQQDGGSFSSDDSGQQVAGPLLAGCSVAVVSLPPTCEAPAVSSTAQLTGLAQLQAAAACSHAALGQWAATCCRGLVAALGGTCSSRVDSATTHLLVVQPEAATAPHNSSLSPSDSGSGTFGSQGSSRAASAAPPATMGVQPEALLEAVSGQCGGPAAVTALQQRLQAGALLVLPHRWLQDLAAAAEDMCSDALPPRPEDDVGLPMADGCSDWAAWNWHHFAALERQHATAVAPAPAPAPTARDAATAAAATATAARGAASEPVEVHPAAAGGTQAAARRAAAQGRGPAAVSKPPAGQRAAAGRRGVASRDSTPEAEGALLAKPPGNGQPGQAARRAAVADLLAELPSQVPASQPTAAAEFAWPASQPAAGVVPGAARASGSRRGGRAVRSKAAACNDATAALGTFAASQPVGGAEFAVAAAAVAAQRLQSQPAALAAAGSLQSLPAPLAAAIPAAAPAAAPAAQPAGEPAVVDLAGSCGDEGTGQPSVKWCKSSSPPAAPHPGPPTRAVGEAPAATSGLGGRSSGAAAGPPGPPSMFAVLCSRWNLGGAAGPAAAAAGAAAVGTAGAGTVGTEAAGGSNISGVQVRQPALAAPAAASVAATAARPPPPPGYNPLALLLGLPPGHFAAPTGRQPAPVATQLPAATQPPAASQAAGPAAAPADSQGSQGSGPAEEAGEEGAWAGRRNRISRMRAQFMASQEGSQLYYLD